MSRIVTIGEIKDAIELKRVRDPYKDIYSIVMEALPEGGEVILSDRQTTVVIFDEGKREFVKAKYDMTEGQVVPISSEIVTLDGFKPVSQLSIKYFEGNHSFGTRKKATASFLELILELSDVPLLELGKHEGDSCNRYLPVRKYQKS